MSPEYLLRAQQAQLSQPFLTEVLQLPENPCGLLWTHFNIPATTVRPNSNTGHEGSQCSLYSVIPNSYLSAHLPNISKYSL